MPTTLCGRFVPALPLDFLISPRRRRVFLDSPRPDPEQLRALFLSHSKHEEARRKLGEQWGSLEPGCHPRPAGGTLVFSCMCVCP